MSDPLTPANGSVAPARPTGAAPPPADWDAVRAETIAHLRERIRVNTVNPPGNEIGVARYLERVLGGAGVETRLFEPAPGRAALVACIRGTGARRPLHVWTVDSEADIAFVLGLGVDAVISNHPTRVLRQLDRA